MKKVETTCGPTKKKLQVIMAPHQEEKNIGVSTSIGPTTLPTHLPNNN